MGAHSTDGERPHLGRSIVRLEPERIGGTIGRHSVEFVGWGFYDTRPWRNYLHTHSFYEVCYAYAGHGTFRVGDELHEIGADTLFLARPGDVHEIVSSNDDPLGIYFWSYTLLPHPPDTDPSAGSVAAVTTGRSPASRPRLGSAPGRQWAQQQPESSSPADAEQLLQAFTETDGRRVRTQPDQIATLLELLATEARIPGPGHDELVSALATGLVLQTARSLQDQLDQQPAIAADPPEASAVRTMVRYLNDNYDRRVTVRDVAAQVHLSDRHAARLFRAATGSSVHAYLTRIRLETAAQRLLDPHRSVKEVARSCGYPDVRHFTTAFRRHWGAPPAGFRRQGGTTHLAAATQLSPADAPDQATR